MDQQKQCESAKVADQLYQMRPKPTIICYGSLKNYLPPILGTCRISIVWYEKLQEAADSFISEITSPFTKSYKCDEQHTNKGA